MTEEEGGEEWEIDVSFFVLQQALITVGGKEGADRIRNGKRGEGEHKQTNPKATQTTSASASALAAEDDDRGLYILGWGEEKKGKGFPAAAHV